MSSEARILEAPWTGARLSAHGRLGDYTALVILVRLSHTVHRLTWDEGSWTSSTSGTGLSAGSTAFGNWSRKQWEVREMRQRLVGDDVS